MTSGEELSDLTVPGRWDRINHPHQCAGLDGWDLGRLIGDQNAVRVLFPVA
jgi:hypothetical protein